MDKLILYLPRMALGFPQNGYWPTNIFNYFKLAGFYALATNGLVGFCTEDSLILLKASLFPFLPTIIPTLSKNRMT